MTKKKNSAIYFYILTVSIMLSGCGTDSENISSVQTYLRSNLNVPINSNQTLCDLYRKDTPLYQTLSQKTFHFTQITYEGEWDFTESDRPSIETIVEKINILEKNEFINTQIFNKETALALEERSLSLKPVNPCEKEIQIEFESNLLQFPLLNAIHVNEESRKDRELLYKASCLKIGVFVSQKLRRLIQETKDIQDINEVVISALYEKTLEILNEGNRRINLFGQKITPALEDLKLLLNNDDFFQTRILSHVPFGQKVDLNNPMIGRQIIYEVCNG